MERWEYLNTAGNPLDVININQYTDIMYVSEHML